MKALETSVNPETGKPVALRRVFLSPGSRDRSEPMYGLARELTSLGIKVYPSDQTMADDPYQWLNSAFRGQAFVFTRYFNYDGRYLRRQIYRAKMLVCMVVRWWVGSDVLNCLESEQTMRVARQVDKAVDLNITVSPHLVTELRDIGIKAEYVPSFCDFTALQDASPATLPKGVLTYLPTNRRAFYGEEALIAAIEANPDLEFFVIADESHALKHYPNVHSLGWVDDLQSIWSQVGLLLRVTEHDGMPRMVLDALARSRYVIYSESFDGCWFAKSPDQVLKHLEAFKALEAPNVEGPAVVNISKNANHQYAKLIEKHLRSGDLKRRWQVMKAYWQLR